MRGMLVTWRVGGEPIGSPTPACGGCMCSAAAPRRNSSAKTLLLNKLNQRSRQLLASPDGVDIGGVGRRHGGRPGPLSRHDTGHLPILRAQKESKRVERPGALQLERLPSV
ncbi:Hypothetical predicted protein [Cloeon dipterum]|uniref:Uncharacterized protein n=1 Tax=Cloeon dipterum TaxID=197152 RepID=A0A8S1CZ38_9INSE|nr:Hypothetical predicted protein [Cloeon dipterum]